MAASIKDVAQRAGVAISTVSKVLNGYPNVSEQTRNKVNQAIDALNYVPNLMASSLSSKNRRRVALIEFINNQRQAIDEINMLYLFGAFNKAAQERLDVITLFSSVIAEMDEKTLTDYLLTQGVSGLVVYGLNKENKVLRSIIRDHRFHTVLVDVPQLDPSITSVMVDHEHGQYAVARKTCLEAKQCNRVLYLAGRKDGWVTDLRLSGIRRLQQEMGFALTVRYADFSEQKAYAITLNEGQDADVVICASDLMAIGAVNALKQMNIFHPVCGYDGITLMGYVGYRMNTVKQDFYQVSQIAIEEILRLFNGASGRQRLLTYEITQIRHEDIVQ